MAQVAIFFLGGAIGVMGYHMNQVGRQQPELWNTEMAFILIGVVILIIAGTLYVASLARSESGTK